jgi:hypothetical protein
MVSFLSMSAYKGEVAIQSPLILAFSQQGGIGAWLDVEGDREGSMNALVFFSSFSEVAR